jgi:hypothetical protein
MKSISQYSPSHTAGWIADSMEGGPDSSTFVVGLNPLILRLTLPW